jgi:hypothetical protein
MPSKRPEPQPPPRIPRPTSLAVWGLHRPLVTRVALALARAVGPETYWFEIGANDGPVDPDELAELRGLDPTRAFWVDPGDVAPDLRLGRPEHWTILSGLGTDPEAPALVTLMQMPPRLRRVLLERDPAVPATVVLSNTDRAAQYYSADPGTFTEAVAVMNRLGLTFIATTGRVPRANVEDFEHVFEVVAASDPAGVLVVSHQGDSTFGPTFRVGARTALPAFLADLAPGPPRSSQGAA